MAIPTHATSALTNALQTQGSKRHVNGDVEAAGLTPDGLKPGELPQDTGAQDESTQTNGRHVDQAEPSRTNTSAAHTSQPNTSGQRGVSAPYSIYDIERGLAGELALVYTPMWQRMSRTSQLSVFRQAQRLLKQLYDDQRLIVKTFAEGGDYCTVGLAAQHMGDEEYQALLSPYVIAAEYQPREWRRLAFVNRIPPHVQLCFFKALGVWASDNKALSTAAVLPDGDDDRLTDAQRVYLHRLDKWFIPLTVAFGVVLGGVIIWVLWQAARSGYDPAAPATPASSHPHHPHHPDHPNGQSHPLFSYL